MITDDVDAHCATLRGASLDFPFGPEIKVWKVGGRMFAAYALDGSGISLKCRSPHSAAMLIELGKATQPPYLREAGWVMMDWSISRQELLQRLTASYEMVFEGLSPAARLSAGSVRAGSHSSA
jgi:predicted DNA-binding protein (MmcQ/YjbR family)